MAMHSACMHAFPSELSYMLLGPIPLVAAQFLALTRSHDFWPCCSMGLERMTQLLLSWWIFLYRLYIRHELVTQ